MIKIVRTPQTPRLRARRIDVDAEELALRAKQDHKWIYYCGNGGEVTNAYGYPAWTETVVAIASRHGDVAVWYGRAAANKVTLCGSAFAATGDRHAALLWDGRRREGAACARAACRILHAQAFGRSISIFDTGLASCLEVPARYRPSIKLLMHAPSDVFDAVMALIVAKEYLAARQILKREMRQRARVNHAS